MNNPSNQPVQHDDFDCANQHISTHLNENIENPSKIIEKLNSMKYDNSNIDSNIKVEKKKKKNRCHVCRKKVGMLGFKCKCSDKYLFCSTHRLPESHDCVFDHYGEEKKMLAKKLVKVVAEKIQRI
jgi:predicted nucleic acid binding AN1-type Zn finger protein